MVQPTSRPFQLLALDKWNSRVLDDLYAYPGKLGPVFRHFGFFGLLDEWFDFPDDDSGNVKIKVWAPTAQTMKLQLFKHIAVRLTF